jgi:signal transduction histidine kinase
MAANNNDTLSRREMFLEEQGRFTKSNPQHYPAPFQAPLANSDRDVSIRAESLDLILRHAPAAVVVCDADARVTFVNAAARKIALQGQDGAPLKHVPDMWGKMLDSDGRHIRAGQSPCLKALQGETTNNQECRLVRPGAASYDVLFSAVPMTNDREIVGMIATLADITEYKEEELQLREDAVSEERERMAADLHDTLSQSMTAIVLVLAAADREFAGDPDRAHLYCRRAHDMAAGSLAEARRTMWTLSHESLEKEDLAPALSFIAHQLFAGTPVKLTLSLQPEVCTLSEIVRRELLRIGREALANIFKHSNATNVHLDLVYQKREVQLCVFDDGHGFTGDRQRNANRGSGLKNMRKRAERMGGKLVVNSLPGQGTRLMAALPLVSSAAKRAEPEGVVIQPVTRLPAA